jgi:hypothetical protein
MSRKTFRHNTAASSPKWRGKRLSPVPLKSWRARGDEAEIHARIGSGAAVLSAVGAIVSLFIAIGFGLVSHRAQVERDAIDIEEQASRVNLWIESPDGEDSWQIHVLNRSPDPIVNWALIFDKNSSMTGEAIEQVDYIEMIMDPIPPCTELVIELEWPYFESDFDGAWFHDRHGENWYRETLGDLLEELPGGTYRTKSLPEDGVLASVPANSCEAS